MASASKRKAELIALLTQIALKGRSSGVLVVARSSPALILTRKCGKVTTSRQNSSRPAPAELVRMVFPISSLGSLPARQFGRLCLCRWTARKRTRTLSCSIFSENWKMFLNGGFVVAFDCQKGTCVNPL